jgi:hypothetical protein
MPPLPYSARASAQIVGRPNTGRIDNDTAKKWKISAAPMMDWSEILRKSID